MFGPRRHCKQFLSWHRAGARTAAKLALQILLGFGPTCISPPPGCSSPSPPSSSPRNSAGTPWRSLPKNKAWLQNPALWARRGSVTGAARGAHLACRALVWPEKPTQPARQRHSPPGSDRPRRRYRTSQSHQITNLALARSSGNRATTRRLNLKKEPRRRANCSAGAQGTMGRNVVLRDRPSGAWPRESETLVPRCPSGTCSPVGDTQEQVVWPFNASVLKLRNISIPKFLHLQNGNA